MRRYAQIAFTEAVREVQEEEGSRRAAGRLAFGAEEPDPLGPHEAAFIAERDGFYFATAGETGWPYVQFRGGPPGFVHVVDESTLAYADVRGNRQYISNGNLRANDRASLFFMDYPAQTRLKVFGRAAVRSLDEEPGLAERVCARRTDGRVERLVVVRVEAYSWNCAQHIPQRFTRADLEPLLTEIRSLRSDKAALESEVAALRRTLGTRGGRGTADPVG
ncbi:pyridoxamine 5'-phosphate oxidase family protein [Nocardiopsis potens]|uniref:pyridoxamine 5'-phosphate oxidase family protein n=1 Tax=Nocardiopsis potens TaxID=1246458 RepID=UPI000346EB27|nr:pyridoxamine 5'-phosphate oxidase family protein [Nocardiopsis potens]